MVNQGILNIVFTISDINNYARYLSVVLVSILENNKDKNLNFFVIYDEFNKSNLEKIKKIAKKYNNCKIEFIKIDNLVFKGCKMLKTMHHKPIIFAKLFIPKILDKIDKVLFLDCDIICTGSLSKLYSKNLDNFKIAAVSDIFRINSNKIKILGTKKYFNAGVMLLNLKELRKSDEFMKAFRLCQDQNNKFEFIEQDALNIVFDNNYLELDLKYNYKGSFDYNKLLDKKDVIIAHSTGKKKFDHYLCDHSFKEEYFKYLNLTPFKNYPVQGKNIKNIYKLCIKKLKLKTRPLRYKIKQLFN